MSEKIKPYGGFWLRFVSAFIDGVVMLGVSAAINFAMGTSLVPQPGATANPSDMIFSFLFNAIAGLVYYTFFQMHFKGTLGKHALGLTLVDQRTLGKISIGQSFGRYCMQFISMFVLGIGYFSVGWNAKKQGWHDRSAGTLVIKKAHLKDMIKKKQAPKVTPVKTVPKAA